MSAYSYTSEKQLVFLLKKGDEKAFESLYYMYSKAIYGNILRFVKSPAIAEELLQDLFQRVWEKHRSIDPKKSFKSFLFTIAKHLVYDFFRREVKRRDMEAYLIAVSSTSYNHITDTLATKETGWQLEHALDQLPPKRKLIFTLCKIEGKSYEEVSRLLGISTATISDHIVKATKSVKNHVSSHMASYLTAISAYLIS